jgi:RNA polymerase sigma-70 factor (ECF subfamily)
LDQTQKIANLIAAGARRLLGRAVANRGLQESDLVSRLRAVVDKYVLKTAPNAGAAEINAFLDSLHADDLCLVLACERGDEAAWNELFAGYNATVKSAARSASANESAADDLAQSIWAELHGLRNRQDGRPAGKLSYYSGAGSLGGWLRAVVGQLAVDRHRREARLVQTEEDADLDRLSSSVDGRALSLLKPLPDPEAALTNNLAATATENALAQVLSELEPEDRLLVKLYYFDGLRLREAGAVLGVHEATASRRLTRIHAEIRKGVEAVLMKQHGWTQTEATRSLAEVAAHLQLDIEPLLAAPADSAVQSSA